MVGNKSISTESLQVKPELIQRALKQRMLRHRGMNPDDLEQSAIDYAESMEAKLANANKPPLTRTQIAREFIKFGDRNTKYNLGPKERKLLLRLCRADKVVTSIDLIKYVGIGMKISSKNQKMNSLRSLIRVLKKKIASTNFDHILSIQSRNSVGYYLAVTHSRLKSAKQLL